MPQLRNLILHDPNRGRYVLISPRALAVCHGFRHDDLEAGGILIGNRRRDHLEVVYATAPGPKDIRKRTRFTRQDPSHNKTLERLWKKSGGTLTYLGDWHTHPEPIPSPSSIDTGSWQELWRRLNIPLVFVIVGQQGEGGWLVSSGIEKLNHQPSSILRI